MPKDTESLIAFLTGMAVDDGAVVIAPREDTFRGRQRDFLDDLRTAPAAISAKPGVNPYTEMLNRPGRWMFIWIPSQR